MRDVLMLIIINNLLQEEKSHFFLTADVHALVHSMG